MPKAKLQPSSLMQEAVMALTGARENTARPPSITALGQGGKFSPDGQALIHPGNTFICHIDPQSDAFAALVAYQDACKGSSLADSFTFLSASSLHMTVFCGVSGMPLGVDGWPDGHDKAATLDDLTRLFAEKTANWAGPAAFRVKAAGLKNPGTVALVAATDRDHDALWQARSDLQATTGLHRPDFATYQFHISIAYQTRWLTEDEANAAIKLTEDLYRTHLAGIGDIALGPIELCRFQTMQHFETQRRLGVPPRA